MKHKLKDEKVTDNINQSLLPTNIGARSYFKRVQKYVSNGKGNLKRIKEEKKNTSMEIYRDPFPTKVIKNLIRTEKELQKKIKKIQENEKLFKSKSYLKYFNKNPINLKKDQDIIKSKVNDLSKNKNFMMSRADYINSEIYNLQNKQDIESGDFKNKILQNMNKLKLNLESMKEKHPSNKSSDNVYDFKLVKLLDYKEEEKIREDQKLLALKNMRDKELEDIKKRKEKNQEELLKILKYRNLKPKKGYYLYEKLYNNYLDREDNLIKKENAKRRAYMKHIDSHEFMEMERSYIERRIQIEENIKERNHSLKQEWTERQKLIPNYINPFLKHLNEEQEKNEQEKKLKLQKIIENKNNMINFSNKLQKHKKLDKIEMNMSSDKVPKNKIFNQNLCIKNRYGDKIRKKMMKKIEKSKEKSKEKGKENEENINTRDIKIVKSIPSIVQKERSFITNTIENYSNKKKKNIFNQKAQDYLAEKRKKLKPILNNIYANDIKKYLQKCGITENSLLMSKYKLDFLKEKKEQKDFLLKYNGGVANNPEIGEELFNLSLNIIKGKLAIIEEIEKKYDENDKKLKIDNNHNEPDSELKNESEFLPDNEHKKK